MPYDAVTYNIVLRLCARDGAYQRAAELLDEMVADPSPKVRPDVFSFTTAIKACCVEPKRRRRDDPRGAARFALGLLSRCADANEVTFRTALRACVGRPDDPPPQRGAARGARRARAHARGGLPPMRPGDVVDGATLARLRRGARRRRLLGRGRAGAGFRTRGSAQR